MKNQIRECAAGAIIKSNYNSPVILTTFILGFAGNAIALWIFCFHVKSRRPNIVYSLNLMIAETLLMCCLPFRTHYFIRGKNWIFGDAACRLNIFMISLNRVGSIIFLMVIAIDRYFKVVHPFHKANKISPRCAAKLAVALWVVPVGICSHLLADRHDFQQSNMTYCEPFNINNPLRPTAIWTETVFIFFTFILPVSVIVFSTSCIVWKLRQMQTEMRGKYTRTVKLVIAVVIVFVICFLPTNIAMLAVLVTEQNTTDCKYITAVNMFYNTLFVTYLNSVIDPVIYYFSNSAFKDVLRKALVHLNLRTGKSATSQDTEQGNSKEDRQCWTNKRHPGHLQPGLNQKPVIG